MADDRYRGEGGGGSDWRGERGRERSNSIFGDDDRERGRHGSGGEDRGFLERAGEGLRSFFTGDEDQRGFGGRGDYEGGGRSFRGGSQGRRGERFSGAEHEHYRNWRDRQIAELDRDYEEYCRERQQLFHSDFGGWRQGRQRGPAGQSDLGASASTGSSGTSALLGDPSHTGPGGDATGEAMSETGGGRSDS